MPSLITQKQLFMRFPFSEFYRFISEFCTIIFWLLLKSGFHRTLCLKISCCPFPDRYSSQGKVKFYNQCLLERALINLLLWTAKKCWQNALPYCLTCMWLPAFSSSWEAIPAACPEVGGGTDTPTASRLGSESARSQADWDSEEPDLMKNVPSHGRRDGLEWFPKVTCNSKQSVILWKSFQGSVPYQVYIWFCSLCSHVRTTVMLLELCSLFMLAYRFSWCSELWISHSQAVQSHLYSPCDSWIRSVRCYTKFLTCKEVFNPVLTLWLGFFSVPQFCTSYWMLISSVKYSQILYLRLILKQFHFPQHSSLLFSKNSHWLWIVF